MDLDMFGQTIEPPKEKRGRPKHAPTDDSRSMVSLLVSLHRRHGEIAATLNISEPTLRKAYRDELALGRDRIRAEVQFRALEQVRAGNVSAMNLLLRELDRADLVEARRNFDGAEPPEPDGKKARAAAAAVAAADGEDGEWGDDLKFAGGAPLN